ncbi:MAG TPA: fumarylacetoacetate hydrolase family protein [Usitatibacteraceae bacterium]|nr:fumarylacetoacetate hydrolase family protein [Usitatibacteraceae bacterium]
MRLVTYCAGPAGPARAGVRVGHRILDIEAASRVKGEPLPSSMKALFAAGRGALSRVQALAKAATSEARSFSQAMHEERAIRLLPPVPDADKFLCVGKNYRQHLDELVKNDLLKEIPQEPTAFVKLNSSLVGNDAKVARPQGIVRLDYEPELVFVIGRRALGVKKIDAMDYVAGVTILNDLTCRDLQKKEVASGSRFWTGKNIPGFGPLGPEIVTMDEVPDPYDLWMTCSVNGVERMRVNTRDQIWKLPDILEHFSRHIPVEPGDMFSTGAPGGVAVGKPNAAELFLKPGDVVECSIEGIATLRTFIVAPGEA